MSGYSDLTVYESEAERHAVCAELARMLRIVPVHLSPATASPSRNALDFHPLDRAVAGDSIDQGVIA